MAKMTPRSRLIAAIDRRPVDAIPVSPRTWAYRAWKGIGPLELAELYDYDPHESAGGLATPLDDVACRSAKLPKDVKIEMTVSRDGAKRTITRTLKTPGGDLHDVAVVPDPDSQYGVSGDPEWIEPIVKSTRDAELLACVLPDPGDLDMDGYRAAERRWGDRGLLSFRASAGADTLAINAMGIANAMLLLYDDEALFDRVLAVADDWNVAVMKRALEGGARFFFDSFFNFSLSAGWSPATWQQKFHPILKRHVDLVHSYGGKVIFYDDGSVMKVIHLIVSAGADALQTLTPPPTVDTDFELLGREYGGRICFWGGVDLARILYGTDAEIDRQVREVVEKLGPVGTIIGTSDSIREGSPEANVRAFFEAGRKHGRLTDSR